MCPRHPTCCSPRGISSSVYFFSRSFATFFLPKVPIATNTPYVIEVICQVKTSACPFCEKAVASSHGNPQFLLSRLKLQQILIKFQPYGYGSIPINTIFRGNEHPFTSYFDVHQGYQGFDTLPYLIHQYSPNHS